MNTPLHLYEIINMMKSKNGDELFEAVSEILIRVGISVYNEDGSVKDLYVVLCEIAEVLNKEKKI